MIKSEYLVRISWKWGAILDYKFINEEIAKEFIKNNSKYIIRYMVL